MASSSSSICLHFSQNAWKKDLCSNCFKSKDEHKHAAALAANAKYKSVSSNITLSQTKAQNNPKTDYPNKNKTPFKSSIKKSTATKSKSKSHKVSFPKNLSEVIGYGGEWSDDSDDDHDFMNLANEHEDDKCSGDDDADVLELKRITRANTDYNMNNGNLLGDPQENLKKTFAALKLGAPQVDKEGKKQTLQINVMPFGSPGGEMKEIKPTKSSTTTTTTQITSTSSKTSSKTKVLETKSTNEKAEKTPTMLVAKKVTTNTSSVGTATTNKTVHETVAVSSSSCSSSITTSTTSKTATSSTTPMDSESGKKSPPIERAMEKSLLDEISETLEKKQSEKLASENKTATSSTSSCTSSSASTAAANKIKFEIGSLSESLESKTFLDLKKPIVRNQPITKDQVKPKVNVFHKYSDSESNCSDSENGVSAYYDVVESQTYENLPDGKYEMKNNQNGAAVKTESKEKSNIFSTSQYITDMLLSSKTRAASYNLHEGNFMTSKITSDGLIVTKCSSDDALDSTGSSFDGSSDEETSYNMIRSESDSGIGISIGHDYKNLKLPEKQRNDRMRVEKKLSASTNNSDYEDIQVTDQRPILLNSKELKSSSSPAEASKFNVEKSRELHGEPDGSADPDGSLEHQKEPLQVPALPKSPPPSKLSEPTRSAFMQSLQKQHAPVMMKKPDLPAKPLVSPTQNSPMKTFMTKRPASETQAQTQPQQLISQLQMVMTKSAENLETSDANKSTAAKEDDSKLKKGKAPNPPMETSNKVAAPPTPERDYDAAIEFKKDEQKSLKQDTHKQNDESSKLAAKEQDNLSKLNASSSALFAENVFAAHSIYARKPGHNTVTSMGTVGKSSAAAMIQEKSKRERAVINPKFRSLNTFVTQRSNAIKNLQLQNVTTSLSFKPMTPESSPKKPKSFSMSEENLAEAEANIKSVTTSVSITNLASASAGDKKGSSTPAKSKTKFSIKKFLRMGASKSTDNFNGKNKESIYSEICTGEEAGVTGKPRLVIIHPIDINPTAVEVVRGGGDMTKSADSTVNSANGTAAASASAAVVTSKPPQPPVRMTDTQKQLELNKPARPPPPKSAELRRKQMGALSSTPQSARASLTQRMDVTDNAGSTVTTASSISSGGSNTKTGNTTRIIGGTEQQNGSIKSKSDNVYANLGEIRSSIAPRKPERTASMREREAQLELARKRQNGATNLQQQQTNGKENGDTISICSSNGENVLAEQQQQQQQQQHSINLQGGSMATITTTAITTTATNKAITNSKQQQQQLTNANNNNKMIDGKPPSGSRTSTFERKKNEAKPNISNKLEIFENNSNGSNTNNTNNTNSNTNNNNNNNNINHYANTSATQSSTSSVDGSSRPNSLKDSVRKINSTIDSYLKDKREYENMYEFVKTPSSPPPPPARSADLQAQQRLMQQQRRNNLQLDTISVASYTRSEYGTARNYGVNLNGSLANIPRMTSASYCGSDVGDLDIYSPYSYYGSENGADLVNDINDSVWGIPSAGKNRSKTTNRLRMRKGRSVVHKSIEDNYSAVVGANHEALAQVLDQLQQTPIIPPALRPLANAINLRFEDFTILEGGQAFVVGKKAFHAAVWTTAAVTLALSADCNQLSGVGGELNQLSGGISGALNPITEFCDIVPSYHLPLMPSTEVTLLQATISVMPRLQLDTLQTIGAILKGKSQVLDKSNFNFRGSIPNLTILKDSANSAGTSNLRNGMSVQNLSTLNEESASLTLNVIPTTTSADSDCNGGGITTSNPNGMPAFDDVMTREVAFIMLQLINGMKNLQVKAVEEMPLSLSNVVLSKEYDNKDAQARLCVLQGNNNNEEDEPMGTLCKCAHVALTEMLPQTKVTPILADILLQERSESLSKSKSVLEFVLWGPSDVALVGSTKEREMALQRWLDLERATVLHGLVRTRVELTVYDECHLMFLVRSTSKVMNDAAKLITTYQNHQQQQQ